MTDYICPRMIQRYFIQLSYDGTPFHGWQIQPNAKSIQESLNTVLSTITRQEIYVVGCGRTDTGVHSSKYFAHFESEPIDTELMAYKANCMLPKEIAIQKIFPVAADTHARFSATSRTYEYFITQVKDPFSVNRAYELHEKLDIEAMNQACALMPNFKDFSSFSKSNTQTETNLCDLYYARWETTKTGLRFEVKANRFLRNMVRAIVGTCIEVGRGNLSVEDFARVIESKDRGKAGYSVPAHGLYLMDIEYPEGLIE